MYKQEDSSPFVSISGRQFAFTAIVGGIMGLFYWGLALVFDTYIFKPIFCHGLISEQCAASFWYASMLANLVATGLGAYFLVKLRIFRPLLVVLSAITGLWGFASVATLLPWYVAGLMSVILFSIAVTLFAWIARIRSFLLSLIVMIVLIVAIRLVLNS